MDCCSSHSSYSGHYSRRGKTRRPPSNMAQMMMSSGTGTPGEDLAKIYIWYRSILSSGPTPDFIESRFASSCMVRVALRCGFAGPRTSQNEAG